MDEPRAQSDNAVSVALAGLDRRIDDKADSLQKDMAALERLAQKDFERLDQQIKGLRDILEEREKHTVLQQTKFEDQVKHNDEKASETRQTLADLSTTKATTRELETGFTQRDARLDALTSVVTDLRSRLDVGNPALGALQQQQAEQAARSGGFSDGAKILAAVLSSLLVLIGIYTAVQATQNQTYLQDQPAVTVTTP